MPVSDSRIMRKKLSLRSHQHDKRPNSLLRRQAGSTAAAIATYVVPCNLEFYTEQHIRPTSSAFIALCRSVKFKLKYWIFNIKKSLHIVWKWLKMSHLDFWSLAFFTTFSVHCSVFYENLAKWTNFWAFLINFCPLKM